MVLATNELLPPALSGRVGAGPTALLREEVLDPQFRYEAEHLLPHYVAIEKVLALEYLRMGLIGPDDAAAITGVLDAVGPAAIEEWRASSLSDIAFALERFVEGRLPRPVPAWHVDRSRNDLQACAQLMFGRLQLRRTAAALLECGLAAHRLASRTTDVVMPGYTHFQAAQIITPGYYLAALSDQVLRGVRRMAAAYEAIDACPLGSGAMAGQELAWDRARMAGLLGFDRPEPLALTSVSSRAWVAEVTAEMGLAGLSLSRFCTDLLAWGSSEYGFIDLPDELSGISSAMPQKKNFPVLERIRGKTAHLSAIHLDVTLGQRNTPFANLVEVSKEAGTHLLTAFTTCRGALRLLTAVLDGLEFRTDRMAAACEREFFGGFSLANALTLREGVPWRRAQVIAGAYILAAVEDGRRPLPTDPGSLAGIAEAHGQPLKDPAGALADAFDTGQALERMRSDGSARPAAVRAVLADQRHEYLRLAAWWTGREDRAAGRPAADDTAAGGEPSHGPAHDAG